MSQHADPPHRLFAAGGDQGEARGFKTHPDEGRPDHPWECVRARRLPAAHPLRRGAFLESTVSQRTCRHQLRSYANVSPLLPQLGRGLQVHSAGPTLAGLKLNKPLDLDYSLRTKFNLNLGELAGFASQCRHWPSAVSMRASPIPDWNTVEVSGVCAADESAGGIWVGFAIQKEINAMINDSMWWMQHPCMLLLPGLVRGAGSDMEANNPSRVVGQLQVIAWVESPPPRQPPTAEQLHSLAPLGESSL